MSESWLDRVSFVVRAYDKGSMPQREAMTESWHLDVYVGQRIDRGKLLEELEGDLRGKSYALEEKYSHFSWGAEAASLTIILDVSTAVGGIAGAAYLIEKIANRIGRRRVELESNDQAMLRRSLRTWMAEAIEVPPRSVLVEEVESTRAGIRATVSTPRGVFRVQVNRRGGWQFKKVRGG